MMEELNRIVPVPKTEEERARDRNEHMGMYVGFVVEAAHGYHTNRRTGYPDPSDMGMLTRTQQLGLAVSYGGEEPPAHIKQAVLRALNQEPDGVTDERLAAKANRLMVEVFRLALERFRAKLGEREA